MVSKGLPRPGLAAVLVGENPASQSYVRAKQNTAHELGFYSVQDSQPADLDEGKLLQLISCESVKWDYVFQEIQFFLGHVLRQGRFARALLPVIDPGFPFPIGLELILKILPRWRQLPLAQQAHIKGVKPCLSPATP